MVQRIIEGGLLDIDYSLAVQLPMANLKKEIEHV